MAEFRHILNALKAENRLRAIPDPDNRFLLDLSSNDYLGLGADTPRFRREFNRRFPDVAFTSSASRLLSARQDCHLGLEQFLESLYGKPALLFNSGYHANVGTVGALSLPGTLFIADKLIHASFIDGLRCAGVPFKRFAHNDTAALGKILRKEQGNWERMVVAVESVYSMDGDFAPLDEIQRLKDLYPSMMLYVDEAHALGVEGLRGLGMCERLGIIGRTDIIVGTLGKAAASAGAFVIAAQEVKELLVNLARPFIFSTALPPANQAWSLMMMETVVKSQPLRSHLHSLSEWFRDEIESITGQPNPSRSQIVPLLTGDAARALLISATLRREGIAALPIRRPTVPPGGERIRFSLSAAMTRQQLEPVVETLRRILR